MSTDERILLQQVSEGDETAFREVFAHYYPKVKVFLGEFIDNEDDVKDLSQNIFVKVWLMRGTLSEVRSFGAYLYRMTRNAAIDYCKRHKVKIPLADEYEEPSSYPLDEEFFARELSCRYAGRVDRMPG